RRVVEAGAEPERRERHAELDGEADAQPALEVRLDRLRSFPHLAKAAAGHEHARARHHLDPLGRRIGRAGDQEGGGEDGFRHPTHEFRFLRLMFVARRAATLQPRRAAALGVASPGERNDGPAPARCTPGRRGRRPAGYSGSSRIPPPGSTPARQPGGSQVVALYSVTMAGPRSRCPARSRSRPKRGTRRVRPWRTTSAKPSGRGSGAGARGRRGSGTSGPGAVASTRSVTASTGALRRAKP